MPAFFLSVIIGKSFLIVKGKSGKKEISNLKKHGRIKTELSPSRERKDSSVCNHQPVISDRVTFPVRPLGQVGAWASIFR